MLDFLVELYGLLASGVTSFFERSVADVLRDVFDIAIVATLIYALLVAS